MFSLTSAAIPLFAICASILALQLVALAFWTGVVRTRHKQWVNPEDARLNKGTQVETDHADVARVRRAHQNALENAVPFFVVGLLYALTSPSHTGALAYFGTFTGVRLLHSGFYLFGRQPFRTLMFAVGVLAIVGMAIHVIRVAT